ncbi:hypothetical protein X737_08145 [Mesorhizobium sp. L48C026A00]|nr:hypothetical protein X737_08145 [Mesorhizobium sp. L48C026A00]
MHPIVPSFVYVGSFTASTRKSESIFGKYDALI